MEERPVVTVLLRNNGAILLCRRSEAVGSCSGRWAGVAGHVEESPEAAARQEIREKTGLSSESIALVYKGEPFTVEDSDLTIQWTVHPFLFDWETASYEWVAPTEILRRETVPNLWKSYDRVRPTVETIAEDSEHGSAWLSIRALEVLRDEAALSVREADDGSAIAAVAEEHRKRREWE